MAKKVNKEEMQEKHNRAYELRLAGKTYRDIGRILGIGHGTAERWCKAHMESVALPLIDEVRKQEVDRLMRYLDRLDERVEEGDDKAISIALKISERLCKMLGADMPTQHVVENRETSQLDLDIADLIASQKAVNALERERAAGKAFGYQQEDQQAGESL